MFPVRYGHADLIKGVLIQFNILNCSFKFLCLQHEENRKWRNSEG
jgi:hypothetical protein